jgi:hypothetical protein
MMNTLWHAGGIIQAWEWIFIIYFVVLAASYLLLDVIALVSLSRYLPEHTLDRLPEGYTGFEPGISLLVPAYNEASDDSKFDSILTPTDICGIRNYRHQ